MTSPVSRGVFVVGVLLAALVGAGVGVVFATGVRSDLEDADRALQARIDRAKPALRITYRRGPSKVLSTTDLKTVFADCAGESTVIGGGWELNGGRVSVLGSFPDRNYGNHWGADILATDEVRTEVFPLAVCLSGRGIKVSGP